jgi:acyl-coenzyme A synthetase/AMP-(fatty) acid ligase
MKDVVRCQPIAKGAEQLRRPPNLENYEQARAEVSWAAARRDLDGLPDGRGLNIAHEAVDRHASGARAAQVALRWLGRDGARREYTYRDLRALTNRFANALTGLGVGRAETVMLLAGRIPELYIAALGALKNRCVFTAWAGRLKAWGHAADEARAAIESAVAAEVAEAVAFAEAGAWEPVADLLRDVYTPSPRGGAEQA